MILSLQSITTTTALTTSAAIDVHAQGADSQYSTVSFTLGKTSLSLNCSVQIIEI